MLVESDLFRHLPVTELSAAAHYFGLNRVAQGDTLFEEGDTGTFMCLVHSGSVEMTKAGRKERPGKMVTFGNGRAFGEMAVLDREQRPATCLAAEDSVLLTLSKEALDQMLEEHPRIGSQFVRTIALSLSRRLHTAAEQLVDHII